ncbi:hypothetical protein GGX14DRAFT_387275 [Mycena pura]|uniref:Uncharacterized protein n=1 Tax=Mycena pura TaxID=153505 RepID=A0AAD7E2F6_9AGAR|nr:hypothetical protein GGX14DRAFT_387275 [Mycena pura]
MPNRVPVTSHGEGHDAASKWHIVGRGLTDRDAIPARGTDSESRTAAFYDSDTCLVGRYCLFLADLHASEYILACHISLLTSGMPCGLSKNKPQWHYRLSRKSTPLAWESLKDLFGDGSLLAALIRVLPLDPLQTQHTQLTPVVMRARRDMPINVSDLLATKKSRKGKSRAKTGTTAAGFLHGYILIGLTRADVAPSCLSAATLAAFERQWEPDFLAKLRQRLRDTSTVKDPIIFTAYANQTPTVTEKLKRSTLFGNP